MKMNMVSNVNCFRKDLVYLPVPWDFINKLYIVITDVYLDKKI